VLTRDPADVVAYAAQLAPRGIDVIAMPVTRTAPAADPRALARALATGPFAAIVVVSARGAAELVRVLADSSALAPPPEIWAIGPATLQALAVANVPAQHPPNVRDGADLARALVASGVTGRVLVPRAEDGRPEVVDILRASGAEVVDVAAYRTLAVAADDPALAAGRAALSAGAVCGVFAPSQVTALVTLLGPLDRLATRFCAIGETTAAALRVAGIAEPAVATAPTPEAFARAVAALCSPSA
jgi:uroporphyrinogen-III synthase